MNSQSINSIFFTITVGMVVLICGPNSAAGQSSDHLYLPPVVGVDTSSKQRAGDSNRGSTLPSHGAKSGDDGQVTDLDLLPQRSGQEKSSDLRNNLAGTGKSSVTKMVGSLAVVLGLFLVLAWFAKRNMPAGQRFLASEVVEVLGKSPLSGKQSMHLVRLGQKLLLISVTPQGSRTLAEITAPAEVERLLSLCQQNSHGSVSESFRDVLTQFEHESADGFLEPQTRTDSFGERG
jgi:flagellar biogenesis protein FliO